MKQWNRINRLPFILLMILSAIVPAAGGAQTREETVVPGLDEPYWQQRVDYEIRVTLDPETHMLTGRETIYYRNNSPDTLREFYLHLYPNAYNEKASPLLRGFLQGTAYFFVGLTKGRRGWLEVATLNVNDKEVEFSVDYTILESAFPAPLPPGGTATIELTFTERIRKVLGRAGYRGNHYDMAQWYPKMVVYDRLGWHPDPFELGEFYGEFGSFDVYIETPERFVIAATGLPVSGDPGWETNGPSGHGGGGVSNGEKAANKTVHFHAENVHDFAWCANPNFVVQDTVYNDYRIMSFFEPWRRSWQDSVLARGLRTMQWLESFAGPYGYPQLSIVQSYSHGGMEYPMLVMNSNSSEELILHEVGHQYFYGFLANDEREEGWMDEGFTQYQTFLYVLDHYGPYGKDGKSKGFLSSLYAEPPLWEGLAQPVIDLHRTDHIERIATPHHKFLNNGSVLLYIKAPLFLRALHHVVGDENFKEIIRTYTERWKFKHVNERAFFTVCEEVSGMDLGEFFKQWLHTTKDCDYRISRFTVKPEGERYNAALKIERKGEMITPITVVFHLEDGNTVTERMDGTLRTIERDFTFNVEPVSVAINPENEILDIRQIDNFLPRRRDLKLDLPYRDYYRQDAFEYRVLPIGYYNDVDGGKAGLRIRGGYADRYRKFTLQGLYGFESEQRDVYGSFSHPVGALGRDAYFHINGFYREGRQGAYTEIRKTRRKSLYDPFAKFLTVRFLYHELFDPAYVFPHTYEEGINLRAGLNFRIAPKTDAFATSFSFDFDRSIWGSDFNYEKTALEAKLWPSRYYPLPLKPYVRFFLGYSSIDPPPQEAFNLAGAGALEKERYFWLRSVGAFPKDYYSNFHLPGDANLRGYFDGDYSFRRVFASNIEMEIPFPLPVGRSVSRWLRHRLYLFYDWGKILDKHPLEALPPALRIAFPEEVFDEMLQDFGVGVNLWKLTVEFPLYISHPVFTGEENEWDFRWTVGFHRLF